MSQELNSDMFQKLLEDPSVKAAVQKAGADALNNPEVQEELLKKAKDKFPGIASSAGDKIAVFAQDPKNQAKAYKYAGVAAETALGYMTHAKSDFVQQIEQGPAGVRFLAFVGGVGSSVVAGIHLANIFGILTHTVQYVMCGYLLIFSLTVVIFEGKVEWIEKAAFLLNYQELLIEKAKFLSEVLGRGLFYIFISTLWFSTFNLTSIMGFVQLGLGGYLLLIGALHVFMHFGIMPREVVEKVRAARRASYSAVGTRENTSDVERS